MGESVEKESIPISRPQQRVVRRFEQLQEWLRDGVYEIKQPHEYVHERSSELDDLAGDCQEMLDSIKKLLGSEG